MIDSLKTTAGIQGIPWQTLLKEALQVIFMESFLELPQASEATFQGGSCLRLIHGGPRHSEDLDFVVGVKQALERWDKLREPLARKLKSREALLQGSLELTAQESFSKILRWKLKWAPEPGAGKVFVRVEWAAYPALTRELKPLSRPPGLPSGPWILVPAESREELLADKLVAIAGRPYLKGRDFFDLWFLRSQGVLLDAGLLRRKLKDYGAAPEGLRRRGREVNEGILRGDLEAFLPAALRLPLEVESYRGVLAAAKATIEEAARALSK